MQFYIHKVFSNNFTRQFLEIVHGWQIIERPIVSLAGEPPKQCSGYIMVIGKCQMCRELYHKQRKTRNACKFC